MPKPAPAVARAARLLDHFARRSDESFSLTQLACAIDASLPSTLAILDALGEAGYVVRHPTHKTYALGPGLIPVSDAAHAANPVVAAARDELALLANEIKCECVGAMPARSEIVFVARAGRPRRDTFAVRIGTRIAYRAPFGFVYAAWAAAPARASWLAHAAPETHGDLLQVLNVVRDRQAYFGTDTEARVRFMKSINASDSVSDSYTDEALLSEVAADAIEINLRPERGSIALVSTPVLSADGHVVLGVTAQGFSTPLDYPAALDVAERIRAGARTIARNSGLGSD